MELSLASAKPSPSPRAAPSAFLFAPLKPLPLLRFPPRRTAPFARLRTQRFQFRRAAGSGDGEGESDAPARGEEVFGGRRELTGVQPLVGSLPPAARTAAERAVAAAAVAAGYGIGLRLGSSFRAVAGPAVLGAASVAGAAAVNSVMPEVAVVGLHDYVAGCDDPTKLETSVSEVEAIASEFGLPCIVVAFVSDYKISSAQHNSECQTKP